jgi:transposase
MLETRKSLIRRESVPEDSDMPPPRQSASRLDPATLPRSTAALRRLLLQREAEHAAAQEQQAAELQAARNGLQELTLLHEKLKARLARLLRQQYGASSEKLRAAINQLELTLGDIEEQIAEMMPPEPEQPSAPVRPTSASVEPARRKPIRRPLPDSLPRDVVEHAAPCACPKCGGALRPLGEDVTEVLDYVPACFRVIRHVRPKLSCRSCESIAQAPVPSLPIQRGLATPALLAHVLVTKYADHCPLYRQAEIYARAGVELDRSTLADWVGQSARLVRPLVDALGAHVMAAERVHADDTTVPVLDPGRGTTKTGRLWCYVRDDRPFGGTAPPAVLYRYSPDRKGEHPRMHLAGFRGILQADGYNRLCRCVPAWRDRSRVYGSLPAAVLRPARVHGLAAGAGGLATYRRAVCHRGDDPRSVARGSPGGAPSAQRPVVQRSADLAGDNPVPDLGQERAGRRHPLHAVALECADLGIARWSCVHRQQCS